MHIYIISFYWEQQYLYNFSIYFNDGHLENIKYYFSASIIWFTRCWELHSFRPSIKIVSGESFLLLLLFQNLKTNSITMPNWIEIHSKFLMQLPASVWWILYVLSANQFTIQSPCISITLIFSTESGQSGQSEFSKTKI